MSLKLFPVSDPVPGTLQLQAMKAVVGMYVLSEPEDGPMEALITLHTRLQEAIRQLSTTGSDNAIAGDDTFFECSWLAQNASLPTEKICEHMPGSNNYRFLVIEWLHKWEERFGGWVHRPEMETQPRRSQIMLMLNFWCNGELTLHTNERRGSPKWLIDNGIWTENRSAGFNRKLQRHVTHEEI